MKTDDLIAMLAAGEVTVVSRAVERRYALGIGLGAVGTIGLMVAVLGIREDLYEALAQPLFWLKQAFVISMAVASLLACLRLSRPGGRLGRIAGALATPICAIWAIAAFTLLAATPPQRLVLVFGTTWTACPFLIAMLSVPVFIGAMWAMTGLGPTRLRLAGAVAGLLAGSISAVVYALHCPEMAPAFIGIWYLLGMLIPTGLGALLGPRLLHW